MVNRCQICKRQALIFIWSTSKVIDKDKLGEIDQFKNIGNLNRIAHPICWACTKEHNLIISVREAKENGTQNI